MTHARRALRRVGSAFRRHSTRALLASAVALGSLCASASLARAADNTIRQPGDHPHYLFEIEPHLDLAWFDYVGYAGLGYDAGIGLGLRATVIVAQNGFIPTINNTVGIGFGGDFIYF